MLEQHLTECEACAREVAAYRRMQELSQQLRFREPPPEFWDEYPKRVCVRLSRGIGWLLIIGFGVLLAGYGAVRLWLSDDPFIVKLGVTGVLAGLGVLLLGVVRQRLDEARNDPYKEIVR